MLSDDTDKSCAIGFVSRFAQAKPFSPARESNVAFDEPYPISLRSRYAGRSVTS